MGEDGPCYQEGHVSLSHNSFVHYLHSLVVSEALVVSAPKSFVACLQIWHKEFLSRMSLKFFHDETSRRSFASLLIVYNISVRSQIMLPGKYVL